MAVSDKYYIKAVCDWLAMAAVAGTLDYAPDGVRAVGWLAIGLLLAHLVYSVHTAERDKNDE